MAVDRSKLVELIEQRLAGKASDALLHKLQESAAECPPNRAEADVVLARMRSSVKIFIDEGLAEVLHEERVQIIERD